MAKKSLLNLMVIDNDTDPTLICDFQSLGDVIIYKVARSKLSSIRSEEPLKQCGIYFLFGEDCVYIGQANFRKNNKGILGRVEEHDKSSESYWNTAFMAISKTDGLGATELNYLEHTCCAKATAAGRYAMKNSNTPTIGKINNKTSFVMDPFIDDIEKILNILGYKIFTTVSAVSSNIETYYLTQNSSISGRSCNATCEHIGDKYTVKAGSQLCTIPTASCQSYIKTIRLDHSADIDKKGILKKDITFDSPSTASSFVVYASSNGKEMWKDGNGIALKDISG